MNSDALTGEEIESILRVKLALHLAAVRAACPMCASLDGDGYCLRHDQNFEYLDQEEEDEP
jgi:hypothetical protein